MIAKKKRSGVNEDFRRGREKGTCDTLELICALLMQDYGFDKEEITKFMRHILDWQSYASDPELTFYISTVHKINKDNGIVFK